MALLDVLALLGAPTAALAVSWFLQSTLLIAAGLAVAALARGRSASLESSVLRATLLGVLLLPLAGPLVGAVGLERLRVGLVPAVVAAPVARPSSPVPTLG